MRKMSLVAVLFLAYLGVAVACLRQWGRPDPWARIDAFSGGYLAGLALQAVAFLAATGRGPQ